MNVKKIIIKYCQILSFLPLIHWLSLYNAFELPKKCFLYSLCLIPLILFPNIILKKRTTILESISFLFILSLFISYFKVENKFLFFDKILFFSVIILTTIQISRSISLTEYIENTLNIHLFNCVFISIYGILQFLRIDIFIVNINHFETTTFGNHNATVYYFIILMPFFIHNLLKFNFSKKTSIYLLSVLVIVFYIFIANSRAVILILIFQIVYFFYRHLKKWRKIFLAIVFSFLFLSLFKYQDKLSDIKRIDRFRVWCWNSTLNMIKVNIFSGVGTGNFEIKYPLYRNKNEINFIRGSSIVIMPHNDYLHILSESGIISFLFFILIFFIKIFKRSNNEDLIISKISIISGMLVMITGWITILTANLFLFFLIVFLNNNRSNNLKGNNNIIIREIIRIFSIIVLIIIFNYNYNFFYSDKFYYLSLKNSNSRRYDNALEDINKAINLFLFKYEYFFQKGNVLRNINKYNDSILCYKRAIQLNSGFAFNYLNIGFCYKQLNKNKEANDNFLRSLEIMPNLDVSLLNLSEYYESINNIKISLKYMKQIDIDQLLNDERRNFYLNRIKRLKLLLK